MFSGHIQGINRKDSRDTKKLRDPPPVGHTGLRQRGTSQPHWRQADTNAHIWFASGAAWGGPAVAVQNAKGISHFRVHWKHWKGEFKKNKAWIALAVLTTTLAGRVALAQTQNGITMGGHIGFVLPLVTHAGGQTINDTADQFSIGLPVGVSPSREAAACMAFDLELVPFINTAPPRQTTLTVHPGLVWNLGHGWGAGARLAFDVNSSDWDLRPSEPQLAH
jgi:hypothetical protein